jgi:site-specific DNA-adenine methylase
MALIGTKNNWDIYNNLLGPLIPNNISIYIEPFGGHFGLYEISKIKPLIAVYNDIDEDTYNYVMRKFTNRNIIFYNEDYKEIFKIYGNMKNAFFYVDCPYLLSKVLL